MNRNFICICLLIVIVECIIGYFLITSFFNDEEHNVKNGQIRASDNIADNIKLTVDQLTESILRDGALFQLEGKLVSPEYYETSLQYNNSVLRNAIFSHRWIPQITNSERVDFENFYRPYYDSNFTIRNIMFNATTQSFNITAIQNKTIYYPFALSVPPFTITLMGGDFSISRLFMDRVFTPFLITVTGRVALQIENSNRDFGMFAYHTVRTDEVLGVVSIGFRPSNLVRKSIELLDITERDYDLIILDLNASISSSLIYADSTYGLDINNDTVFDDNFMKRTIFLFGRNLKIVIKYNEYFNNQFRNNIDITVLITYIIMIFLIDIGILYGYQNHIQQLKIKSETTYKNLLTYINHELRNPLVPITGLVTLSIGLLNDIKTQHTINDLDLVISDLYTVKGHTQLMQYIIDDVLTYRKIKEGKLKVILEDISLQNVIKDINKTISSKVGENPNVEFKIDVHDNVMIHVDKFRVAQILLNLINNSIKFTTKGFIKLSSYVHDTYCTIQVEDTGRGISPDMHKRLFNEFSQEGINSQGSGLGLWICKKLVILMNGHIDHRDRDNGAQGAIFYFNVPLSLNLETVSRSVV